MMVHQFHTLGLTFGMNNIAASTTKRKWWIAFVEFDILCVVIDDVVQSQMTYQIINQPCPEKGCFKNLQ